MSVRERLARADQTDATPVQVGVGQLRMRREHGHEHPNAVVEQLLEDRGLFLAAGERRAHRVELGHREAAQALVEAGARLDLRSHAGLNPRDMALLYGYDAIAAYLEEASTSD